jgi:hypothetical protein
MDEDRDWLKNPILPRPPAVPRFSLAELRLVEDERPSAVVRVATRRERGAPLESHISSRRRQQSGPAELESEAPKSRRFA